MGLMLSVLVGCVGVLELLACLRHVSDGVVITINQPATPCLSYHDQANDNMSTHDSICTFSHSSDVSLPRGAKHKLENLHEYSLRIRTQLRSRDKNFDYGTLSECSARDLLVGSRLTPDSRLSPDFNYLVESSEAGDDYKKRNVREASYDDAEKLRIESSSRDRPLSVINLEPAQYVRVPTPIPYDLDDQASSSGASSDVGTSFDNESGNEAPTTKSFDSIPIIKRYKTPSEGESSIDESDYQEVRLPKRQFRKSKSKSPDPARSQAIEGGMERSRSTENVQENHSGKLEFPEVEIDAPRPSSQKKRSAKSSSTIVRKSTRLKSKASGVSKSAENLAARKSKRHRDPERRKSDISVQTANLLRDESTNTSPLASPSLSRSESRSVQVQTSFEETLASVEALAEAERSVLGLSESRRDLTSRDRRRSFKNRRFGTASRDKADDAVDSPDAFSVTNATSTVEAPLKDVARLLKISSFEEADIEDYERIRGIITDSDAREASEKGRNGSKGFRSVSSADEDESYWDAEDVSAGTGPIQYTIPDPDRNKAFWVMMHPN